MERNERGLGASDSSSTSPMSDEDLSLFGLEMNPFEASHDPRFLLRSSPLGRVLESIRVILDAGNNLALVVGEPGIGKTAAIDAMSRESEDGIRTVCISNPSSSWAEMGQEIGTKLRLAGGRLSPGVMAVDQGAIQTFRVIVDHAEQLSRESIKHLGAYLDLQGGGGKRVHRLQVVLVAKDLEGAPVFRWLASRAHARVDFGLLEFGQARDYVNRRVQIARSKNAPIFSSDALDRVAEIAGGNPGAINRLCRAALHVAASRGSSMVDAETIGTAARRSGGSSAQVLATIPLVAAPAEPVPKLPTASFDELLDKPTVSTRVEILETKKDRSPMGWGIVCAALLGVIAGGIGFLYWSQPQPVPPPQIKIVEVEVEKIVEVPIEVVKIVRVEVPVKPKPRAPKPAPKKVAKVKKVAPPPVKPAPKPVIAAKKPVPEPPPSAATVLDRAFAKSQPGDHTRLVEILQHGEDGPKLTQTLKLARIKHNLRTLTIGVLTGDVSSNPRETESRFLSIETGKLEDERFGYRPARGKVEPLKSGRGRDPFYGNSFQYDDFRVRTSKHYLIHKMDRAHIEDESFFSISAKPRFRAAYERVEFVVDARDYALVEIHYFKGLGLRPYRIVQYPKADMKAIGEALVPMRIISRNFQTNQIDEARVVKVEPAKGLDPKLFTLTRIREEHFEIPNL